MSGREHEEQMNTFYGRMSRDLNYMSNMSRERGSIPHSASLRYEGDSLE